MKTARAFLHISLLQFFLSFSSWANPLSAHGTPSLPSFGQSPQAADTAWANALMAKGRAHAEALKLDSALFCHAQARNIYHKLAHARGESADWKGLVKCHNNLADVYRRWGKFQEAHAHADSAIQICQERPEEDPLGLAQSYHVKGILYTIQDQYNNALLMIQQSLGIRQKLLDENDSQIADSYNVLAIIYNEMGKNREALNYHTKALNIRLAKGQEETVDIAKSYNGLGIVYQDLGDYDKGIENLQKALAINLKILGPRSWQESSQYHNLGGAYLLKWDFDNARKYYEQALKITRVAFGENHPEVATAYTNLSRIFKDEGDYETSLEYARRALAIYLKVFGENHSSVANIYNAMGVVYETKGQYGEALPFYEKALKIDLKVFGESNAEVAKRYNNIGIIYARRAEHQKASENHQKALEYFQKSLRIREQTLPAGHPDFLNCFNNLGLLYQEMGDFATALKYLNRMMEHVLSTYGAEHPETADAYVSFGEAYFKQKVYGNALRYYQKAIITAASGFQDSSVYANPSSTASKAAPILLKALSGKAQAFAEFHSSPSLRLKNLEASVQTYRLAATLIEEMLRSYRNEDTRLGFGEEVAEIYEHAISAAHALFALTGNAAHQRRAFAFIEQSKAAALRQALAEARAKTFSGVPAQILSQEKALRLDLANYETEIQKEKFKQAERDSIKIQEFEARHFYLKRDYEKLLARLEKEHPKYYELKYQPRVGTIFDLQKSLDSRTAFLEYALSDSVLHVVLATKARFDIIKVPVGPNFREQVLAFHRALRKVEKQKFLALGPELYRCLLAPVEARLANIAKLIIVPDRELFYLPFEALFAPDSSLNFKREGAARFSKLNYLARKYEIVYHYSAALYLHETKGRAPAKTTGNFIGFAPVFSEAQNNGRILATHRAAFDSSEALDEVRSLTGEGVRLAALKHSAEEVEAVLALFANAPKKSVAYLHQKATEDNFKQEAGRYKYVHVASHSLINEWAPKLSNLVFSQPEDSAFAEDGVLYAAEAYHLELNADLVTLSSCESGVGKLLKGEGMLALTRGFLYAGAPNLLFSLWKVYDRDARDLMVAFYGRVAKGQSYATALREVKLEMMANEATAFPISWAAFVLVGR